MSTIQLLEEIEPNLWNYSYEELLNFLQEE